MTHTIRRKTVKTPEWWHCTVTRRPHDLIDTKPGSKLWDKENATFHSDKFQPDPKMEKQSEREFRTAANRELNKAMNDPEYEVQLRRGRNLNWYWYR